MREGFGMSETPTATHGNPMGQPGKDQSIGVPFPDVECRIVSLLDERTDLPQGEAGELIMRGPNMMLGYLNLPAETDIALRDMQDGGPPWLFTGDIAHMDADGYFYIVDRKKDMALIGGFNVYPTTVEKVLASHPAVGEVGVTRMPHPQREGEEALLAGIVLRAGQSVTPAELVQFQAERLAPYEVARRFAFL
ncbi:MAG: long-chain fatty-acid-CoA ligase, partial [Chloroflexota bacterium]